MGLTRLSLTPLALTLALGTPLWAGEPEPDKKKKPAEIPGATVTVTAEAAAVEVKKTPNPVKVVAEPLLEVHRTETLRELVLDLLPGQVATYGGPGTLTSVYLGGARAQDTVVTLDGIRIGDAGGLGTNLSGIGLASVERAEILVGPASTLFGSEAHGGVLALSSSAAAKAGMSGRAAIGTGTTGLRRLAFDEAYGFDRGWVRAGLTDEQEHTPTETRNAYRQTLRTVGVGYIPAADQVVSLNHRSHDQGSPLPFNWGYDPNTWAPSRAYDHDREALWNQDITTLGWKAAWSDALSSEVSAGQVRSRIEHTDGAWMNHSTRRQATARTTYAAQTWSLTGLLDHWTERSWGADPSKASRGRHSALAGELALEPAEGIRFVASGRQQTDAIGQDTVLEDQTFHQFTWKAGLNVRFSEVLRVYVSSGTAFNTPSLYSLQKNLSLKKPMPVNEESRSLQAGVQWDHRLLTARLDLNEIDYRAVNVWTGDWMNGYYAAAEGMRVRSAELSLGHQTSAWSLEGFLRHQEGRDRKAKPGQEFYPFSGRPFFTTGLRGAFTTGDWRLTGRLSRIGGRYTYDSDKGGYAAMDKPFTDATLQLTWAPLKGWEYSLKADHLLTGKITRQEWERGLDRDRSNLSILPGYPMSPRSLSLEARYRF